MPQTEFFGIIYTVVHGTYTLEGITDVAVEQTGGPQVEMVDKTRYGHSKYTYVAHPLGSKGQPTVKLTVTCKASKNSLADSKAAAIPFNTAAATTVDWEPGTTNANTFAHTTLELTQRTTKIPFKGKDVATVTLVFEGNGAGTWDSPA